MIPELQTARLLMRPWRESDFEAFAGFMADPDVTRHVTGVTLTRPESWRSMAAMIGHWELRGCGNWAIERKSDGLFVGRAGAWYPEGWPELELGWLLGKAYWGHGYATEAAAAAMNFMFETMSLQRIVSLIDPANTPSQAVAARLGEACGDRVEFKVGANMFSVDAWFITRARWQERRA